MDDDTTLSLRTYAKLMGSVLAPYIPDYWDHLVSGRYAERTRYGHLRSLVHFANWLATEELDLGGLNEEVGERFIVDHLPRCTCPYPALRTPRGIRSALSLLFDILRAKGILTTSPTAVTPIGSELSRFDIYMEQVCGHAKKTRYLRIQVVGWFLAGRFGTGPIIPTAITAVDLRQFLLGQGERWSSGSIGVIASALRCYLRFRNLAGDDAMARLAATIPSVANWRLAVLPEVLSPAEVEQLLGSFSDVVPSGKRAYAMVRCLVDLGLRASEVASLHLDDIDWHAGTLRLVKGKSRRADVLPLPAETGRAIADYLYSERPQTASRAVFIRDIAPCGQPIGAGVVRRVVKEAYQRCGWTRTRVHILRHSVASRLLQEGAPLKEIADILRHRSLDTSAIYAKVDTNRLAAVALPWLGRAP